MAEQQREYLERAIEIGGFVESARPSNRLKQCLRDGYLRQGEIFMDGYTRYYVTPAGRAALESEVK